STAMPRYPPRARCQPAQRCTRPAQCPRQWRLMTGLPLGVVKLEPNAAAGSFAPGRPGAGRASALATCARLVRLAGMTSASVAVVTPGQRGRFTVGQGAGRPEALVGRAAGAR